MRNVLQDSAVLLWRAVEAQWTEWRTLEPAPAANLGFIEAQCYVFQLPAPGWSLFIDDEPLRGHADQPSSCEWHPGFFAGEITAELNRPDGISAGLFLLDIAPSPDKVGQQFFAEMVRELWDEDPTLVIGKEPATTPTGELGDPFAAIRINCSELRHGQNGRVLFDRLHPLFEGGLFSVRLLLGGLREVMLALFVVHRTVRGREAGLSAQLLECSEGGRRQDEPGSAAREHLPCDTKQAKCTQRNEIQNDGALRPERVYGIDEEVHLGMSAADEACLGHG